MAITVGEWKKTSDGRVYRSLIRCEECQRERYAIIPSEFLYKEDATRAAINHVVLSFGAEYGCPHEYSAPNAPEDHSADPLLKKLMDTIAENEQEVV